jgi:hypothetical protein
LALLTARDQNSHGQVTAVHQISLRYAATNSASFKQNNNRFLYERFRKSSKSSREN